MMGDTEVLNPERDYLMPDPDLLAMEQRQDRVVHPLLKPQSAGEVKRGEVGIGAMAAVPEPGPDLPCRAEAVGGIGSERRAG